jgi:phosphoribosyl-ATP pyrophosphohydrolase/phosphoribosyl-AMP cyclohydrolase
MSVDIEAELEFDDRGLIPAIVQDVETDEVLMMAYMNQESLEITLKEGRTCFWSRSRQELWRKGETSGHIQQVEEIRYDCDGDTLLVKVQQTGGACHTGHKSCFYRKLEGETAAEKVFAPEEVYNKKDNSSILAELQEVIKDRKQNPQPDSYTSSLYEKGENEFLKKLGEETTEIVMAAVKGDRAEITYEIADFLYHLLVVMVYYNISLEEVFSELKERR